MKIKKYLFVVALICLVSGCSSNDDSVMKGEDYALKAKELAQLSGMRFDIINPSLMTRSDYEKIEKKISILNEQFKNPVVLENVQVVNDTVFVTNRNLMSKIKTRSESIDVTFKGITFIVRVVSSGSGNGYSLKYSASSNGENLTTTVGKEEKAPSGDSIGFKTEITVTLKIGGGYMSCDYVLEGYINGKLGLGKVTAKYK